MAKIAEIRTDRLVLRTLMAEDADDITAQIVDWDVIKMLARPPFPYSKDNAHDYLSRAVNYPWEYAITRDGDALMGVVGITGHLGYWLGKDHWGHGYMTEAAQALIDTYFTEAKSAKIVAGVFTDNAGSQGVLQKLGFVETGRSKMYCNPRAAEFDNIDMELRRTAWRERRAA